MMLWLLLVVLCVRFVFMLCSYVLVVVLLLCVIIVVMSVVLYGCWFEWM